MDRGSPYSRARSSKYKDPEISSGEEEEDLDLDLTLNIEDDYKDEVKPMPGSPPTDVVDSPDEDEKRAWHNEERKRKIEEKIMEALERRKKRKQEQERKKEEEKRVQKRIAVADSIAMALR
ncbi:hypothetical protein ACQJBY_071985 [Aegilops geniculata]